ncbi:MAG: Gfo/Idh/MocA family oxidoreductase [Waddliaceae bacterium]
MKHSQKVGIIGIGSWGKNLARNFFALGALHTLCDRNEENLKQLATLYPGVLVTTDEISLLEDPTIQSVVIATPPFTHFQLAKKALENGKDVYVEKPLCMSISEGNELIALAENAQSILMVGHLLQYHPHFIHLLEFVNQGSLGEIQYVSSNRMNLGPYRTEENALWDLAPHDISMILSLYGNNLPHKVTAQENGFISEGVTGISLTSLEFASGMNAHIYSSWLHPFKEQKLTVVGSKGIAVFDDTKPWEEKLSVILNHIVADEKKVPRIGNNQPTYLKVPQKEPLKEECLHFLTCCENRISSRTNGQEGLRVLKVLAAAQESLKLKESVLLNEETTPEKYFATKQTSSNLKGNPV